ncbi:hypothetical protein KKF34_17320 [Myxococcota bacterium]|nr:hypothetical protein [Myxococcota bacterium]MBU1380297.1 hypothetical protein [Myxococcota bacterium]MBU1498642.1 hypothetical protein [Myxococcota bacterium]
MRKYSFYFYILIAVSCSTPTIMPNHNPGKLNNLKLSVPAVERISSKSVILYLEVDRTTSPIGAWLDDSDDQITPVMKTFVMANPGMVMFEKTALQLEKSGLKVYRLYNDQTYIPAAIKNNSILIKMTIENMEFHVRRTTDLKVYHLGRADISYKVQKNSKVFQGKTSVKGKTTENHDIFEVLAFHFCNTVKELL